ncbi:hypothetical protein NJ76_18190 [Rhodococcus sp. IITR03]|nr:hypothetical protein NJ76_18190 [Rhodococcus sp. IITR03]
MLPYAAWTRQDGRSRTADARTDDELETPIAALYRRERELLVTGDTEAFALLRTKFALLSTLKNRRR